MDVFFRYNFDVEFPPLSISEGFRAIRVLLHGFWGRYLFVSPSETAQKLTNLCKRSGIADSLYRLHRAKSRAVAPSSNRLNCPVGAKKWTAAPYRCLFQIPVAPSPPDHSFPAFWSILSAKFHRILQFRVLIVIHQKYFLFLKSTMRNPFYFNAGISREHFIPKNPDSHHWVYHF